MLGAQHIVLASVAPSNLEWRIHGRFFGWADRFVSRHREGSSKGYHRQWRTKHLLWRWLEPQQWQLSHEDQNHSFTYCFERHIITEDPNRRGIWKTTGMFLQHNAGVSLCPYGHNGCSSVIDHHRSYWCRYQPYSHRFGHDTSRSDMDHRRFIVSWPSRAIDVKKKNSQNAGLELDAFCSSLERSRTYLEEDGC